MIFKTVNNKTALISDSFCLPFFAEPVSDDRNQDGDGGLYGQKYRHSQRARRDFRQAPDESGDKGGGQYDQFLFHNGYFLKDRTTLIVGKSFLPR